MMIQPTSILTVSQITHAIKLCLEGSFSSIWVQGEVSNCKLQTSGHLYFSLKDNTAQISVVMFRGDMAKVSKVPKDGDHLVVRGELNVYPPSGKYQLIAREMRQVGLGELLLKLEELKLKLRERGWFNHEHKKPLPKFPKRIGVVTSPTGAVIQDILNVLSRRFSSFHLILNPVKVQGEGAAFEIAQAIAQFNQYQLVDVMIVGRGGGSLEDLWAFNEEKVAEAIFNSQIPIISAVGHETDHCIADYVADIRAPTPSAAAELVIAEKTQQLLHLEQLRKRLGQSAYSLIRHDRQRLNALIKHPLLQSPYSLLSSWIQKLDLLRDGIERLMKQSISRRQWLVESHQRQLQALRPSTQLVHCRHKLMQLERTLRQLIILRVHHSRKLLKQKEERLSQAWRAKREMRLRLFDPVVKQKQLDYAWKRLFGQQQERLMQLSVMLSAINPKNLLTKGYCIIFSEDNRIITSVQEVNPHQTILTQLSDGMIVSTVTDIQKK